MRTNTTAALLGILGMLATADTRGDVARSVPARHLVLERRRVEEAEGNNGGSARLKVKSNQEMSLIDIDPKPLRGRVVTRATLHLHSTGEPRLKRITVGTFGAEWVEGTAASYEPQPGSSSHNHRRNPDVPWTFPGSDLCSVILGSRRHVLADG